MSKFFIDRPIFAWVIAIFIIAAGIFGIQKLPISQYPSVAAPTITLRATYPGAFAQVMEDSVTRPLSNVICTVWKVWTI